MILMLYLHKEGRPYWASMYLQCGEGFDSRLVEARCCNLESTRVIGSLIFRYFHCLPLKKKCHNSLTYFIFLVPDLLVC